MEHRNGVSLGLKGD